MFRIGAGMGGNQRSKCVTSKDVNMLSLKPQLLKHLLSRLTFYSKRFSEPERNYAGTQSPGQQFEQGRLGIRSLPTGFLPLQHAQRL